MFLKLCTTKKLKNNGWSVIHYLSLHELKKENIIGQWILQELNVEKNVKNKPENQ